MIPSVVYAELLVVVFVVNKTKALTLVVVEADVAEPEPSSTVPVIVTAVVTAAMVDNVNVVVFVPLDDVVTALDIVAVADGTESEYVYTTLLPKPPDQVNTIWPGLDEVIFDITMGVTNKLLYEVVL